MSLIAALRGRGREICGLQRIPRQSGCYTEKSSVQISLLRSLSSHSGLQVLGGLARRDADLLVSASPSMKPGKRGSFTRSSLLVTSCPPLSPLSPLNFGSVAQHGSSATLPYSSIMTQVILDQLGLRSETLPQKKKSSEPNHTPVLLLRFPC